MLGNNHLGNIFAEVITIKTLFALAKLSAIADCISMLLVSASAKKNAEVIKFLGILKNMSPRIKKKLFFKKERKCYA